MSTRLFEALDTVHQLEKELGIAIKVFTKADAESLLGCKLSDEEWTAMREHPDWQSIARLNQDDVSKIRTLVEAMGVETGVPA